MINIFFNPAVYLLICIETIALCEQDEFVTSQKELYSIKECLLHISTFTADMIYCAYQVTMFNIAVEYRLVEISIP